MNYFTYHPETLEYLDTLPMKYSPLDNQPAPPEFSTIQLLPALAVNEAALFDKANDSWNVVPDFRNEVFYLADGTEINLELGEAKTVEMLDAIPDDVLLSNAKELKVLDLYRACSSHILGGFTSDALGGIHTYPSTTTDQANLNGVVTESLVNAAEVNWQAPFWCSDAANVWDRLAHTHTQIQQVGQAAAVHVRDAQDNLKILVDRVNDPATDTIEKVDIINF